MRPIKALSAWLVRVFGGLVVSVWDNASAREMLGRVYELMRQSAHENSVRTARAKYTIADDARWSDGTVLAGDGRISIGQGTYLGIGCHVVAHPTAAKIHIGTGCAISHNVHLRTEGYRLDVPFAEARRLPGSSADITIGDDVWIGAHVFVCGGVTVGNNTVIGANSVVTRDLPPNSVCGGIPARVLRAKDANDANEGEA